MQRIFMLFAIPFLLIFLAIPSLASDNPEISWERDRGEWIATVTYNTDVGDGGSLRMKNIVGNITVTGGKSKKASLVYEVRIDKRIDREEAEALLDEVIPEFTTSGSRISVYGQNSRRGNYNHISTSLNASLPAKFDVDGSTGGGSITVRGLEGTIDMSSGGGSIDVEECQGDFGISTGGGTIELSKIKGMIDVSTGGGSIDLEDVVSDSRGRVSTGGGGIDLINTEGTLTLSTGAGNIRVRDHNGDLRVSTGAGNIDSRDVHGSFNCGTGAGSVDVDVPMDKNAATWTLEVNTGAGSINLRLPGKLPATLHAFVENARSSNDIRSDFDLDISDSRWAGITASGKINGGGMSVKVSSGKGKIYIRKI
ncbi:MAG: hypothetical protein V2A56_10740 [bacterium]